MENKPKILLTGSEGFIGKSFNNFLQKSEKFEVFSPIKADLDLRKHKQVKDYVESVNPDYLIHAATSEAINKEYEDTVCEDNLRMFFNLHRAVSTNTKFFNFTSGSDFSRSAWKQKMHERYFDIDVPKDAHSYSKYVITKFIRAAKNPNLVNLRLFGVFGNLEDYRFKFISNTIAKVLLGLPIVVHKNAKFDYLYIGDLYSAVIRMLSIDLKYVEYNVSPTESIELVDIAKLIREYSGKNMEIKVLHQGLGVTYTGSNNRLLEEMPGFHFTAYEESIRETYDQFEKNRDFLEKDSLENDLFLQYVKTKN